MLKKTFRTIQEVLAMNKSQTIASLILLALLFVVLASYPLIERLLSGSNAEISITTTERLDSLAATFQKESAGLSEMSEMNEKGEVMKRNIQHFAFNPNTATHEQLVALGFPKGSATSLIRYREKGGKLRYKEDVLKIYYFPKELYGELEAYIQLPSRADEEAFTPQQALAETYREKQPTTADATASNNDSKKEFDDKKHAKLSNPATQAFDINTADTTQLKQLKGVGSGYAARIIKYRDLLGGFHDINQVKKTYNLPPEVADEVIRFGFIKKPVKKININEITLENFKHPTLKYNQKKAILAYREQHGRFSTIDDLRKIKLLDEESIREITPYLEF